MCFIEFQKLSLRIRRIALCICFSNAKLAKNRRESNTVIKFREALSFLLLSDILCFRKEWYYCYRNSDIEALRLQWYFIRHKTRVANTTRRKPNIRTCFAEPWKRCEAYAKGDEVVFTTPPCGNTRHRRIKLAWYSVKSITPTSVCY